MAAFEEQDQYTDYIGDDHYLFCWEFRLQSLEEHYGSYYGLPVIAALLQGLKALSEGDGAEKDARFTIWLGDHGAHYWVGVLSDLSANVTNLLGQFFTPVEGYDTSEFGPLSEMGLRPQFRYEAGRIIEYSDESMAGTQRVDDDEWYGSGLTIHYRLAEPAFLVGGERYRG